MTLLNYEAALYNILSFRIFSNATVLWNQLDDSTGIVNGSDESRSENIIILATSLGSIARTKYQF